MDTVQLAIADAAYAAALSELLERSVGGEVRVVERPDAKREGVIVVDSEALERLPLPLVRPERVVLITRNDPEQLSRAWNAGILSVVFCNDPLNTAVLAILAAGLRRSSGGRKEGGFSGGSCSGTGAGERPSRSGPWAAGRDRSQPEGREDKG